MSQASVLPLLPADAAGTLPVAEKEASVTVAELDSPPVEADRRPEESDPAVPVFDLAATHLVSSPYPDVANQLDLRSLATPVRLLAFALSVLAPIRSDYATAPYLESFNWPEVFHALRTLCSRAGVQWQRQEFYLVIFRSQLRRDIDRGRLGELDQRSHEEACASGGLLKYWFGSCDADMRNLATCVWRNREDAAAGGGGPWHHQARAAAREMYESISFYTHRFVIESGAWSWHLEEYAR